MDKPGKAGEAVKIEIVDRRQRDEAAQAAEAGAEQAQPAAPAADPTPEEASAQRLKDRDDAERFYSGDNHHSPAEGSLAEEAPDAVAQAREYLELAQRKEAEFRNYRAQERQRVEDAKRYAVESMLHDLFPVLDGLAQALQTVEPSHEQDAVVMGLRNTAKALEKALLKHGVEKIDAAGVDFDSELHQPIQVELSDQVESDKVIEVYTAGYRLHGRVLKPAMVKVLQPG
jgi:molecular chaperone GrpE